MDITNLSRSKEQKEDLQDNMRDFHQKSFNDIQPIRKEKENSYIILLNYINLH